MKFYNMEENVWEVTVFLLLPWLQMIPCRKTEKKKKYCINNSFIAILQ